MQGMDSASRDWWEITANSKEEAIKLILKKHFPNDSEFAKSCLSASELK